MSQRPSVNRTELVALVEQSWQPFSAYLDTLSDAHLSGPTDAAGWRAQDHLVHVAVWEDNLFPLLTRQSRPAYMEIDELTWTSGDDAINAAIQQRYRNMSVPEVRQMLRDAHQHILDQLNTMPEDAVKQPYNFFQPETSATHPVSDTVIEATCEHYADHQKWIAALISRPAGQ